MRRGSHGVGGVLDFVGLDGSNQPVHHAETLVVNKWRFTLSGDPQIAGGEGEGGVSRSEGGRGAEEDAAPAAPPPTHTHPLPAAAASSSSSAMRRCSVYLLYWYKITNTDADEARAPLSREIFVGVQQLCDEVRHHPPCPRRRSCLRGERGQQRWWGRGCWEMRAQAVSGTWRSRIWGACRRRRRSCREERPSAKWPCCMSWATGRSRSAASHSGGDTASRSYPTAFHWWISKSAL